MPALFIELFSEEIPARLQPRGADELLRLVSDALRALEPHDTRLFYGPRRIALAAQVAASVPGTSSVERGPRSSAPEQALAGFLRKHGAAREALRQEGEFWVLDRASPAVDAATLIAGVMPGLLRRFAWPKSMRWGGTSAFTWIRPLRRIVCLLDGAVVPFDLAGDGDDGHGLASGNLTEGHRHAPGPVAVHDVQQWESALRARHVVADAAERARLIRGGIAGLAAARGLSVVEDSGLIDEVAGLVEWPVPLLGRIDDAFMDLPPEVMQVSMRVNQRYFALRDPDGRAAPWFAFAANLDAPDGGAAIVVGNERVLRARFADARHFWDLDRHVRLADRVAALDHVTFQAELGSQGARVRRIEQIAGLAALLIDVDIVLARHAALLCKADLTTGMVGEFPELQGVMGSYYARHDGEDARVCAAIHDHYAPRGPADAVPSAPLSIVVALADKLDQLTAFFSIGQKPTGSGDPFGLRRAALGVIRIIRENGLRLPLRRILARSASALPMSNETISAEVLGFIVERLRIQLRAEGARHDVLAAVSAIDADDDLVRFLARADALAALLGTRDGINLLAAYKRADNILRIEHRKDGPHVGAIDTSLFTTEAERSLDAAMAHGIRADMLLAQEKFAEAMSVLAELRAPLDAFFEHVTVNAEDAALRVNRLRMLNSLRESLNRVADFSLLEG